MYTAVRDSFDHRNQEAHRREGAELSTEDFTACHIEKI